MGRELDITRYHPIHLAIIGDYKLKCSLNYMQRKALETLKVDENGEYQVIEDPSIMKEKKQLLARDWMHKVNTEFTNEQGNGTIYRATSTNNNTGNLNDILG